MNLGDFRLSEGELDFLVTAAAPEVKEKAGLRRLIETDDDFRQAFIGDEKTFRKVMADQEVFFLIGRDWPDRDQP